ncbi:cell division protein FtsQ/DivIB [Caldovatus aquaticus]|uniref:Cell division protein FtsQ n=1 Tax=Caldovatus aquaticus TaxID=2865671 RepID=A0ABS7EWX3_9PROT|nr:cell division protein FtsQ/DivIB [Caldovatus aquaticus]MBW8267875.1 cell division protein FtsQ/DivIB [Caldovatus aquaticus]
MARDDALTAPPRPPARRAGAAAPARQRRPDRPSRLRLWLRRRRALLRPAALGTLALGALGAAALTLYALDPAGRAARLVESAAELGQRAGWRVQAVILDGREHTPVEMIRAALGVSRGDPILGFSPEGAKERLETLAWVQRAHVERRLPGTIVVRLEERQPFAIWQHSGRFAVIDRAGHVVATEKLDQFGALPLVVGAGAERAAAALLDRLREQPELARRIQAAIRVGDRRWNLKLHNGTEILLPEGHEAAAIERLGELHRQHGLLDRPLAAIDLRLPDRLVVRQQATPQAEQPAAGAPRGGGRSQRG